MSYRGSTLYLTSNNYIKVIFFILKVAQYKQKNIFIKFLNYEKYKIKLVKLSDLVLQKSGGHEEFAFKQ